MASYKINFIANLSKKRKINREKEIRYNIMNKRILIVILILYLNIQVSTLDDNFITLKIKQGNNTFLVINLRIIYQKHTLTTYLRQTLTLIIIPQKVNIQLN